MKIGDKLYCKNNCYNEGILLFEKTCYYKIMKADNVIGLYPMLFSGYPRICFYINEENRFHSAYDLFLWDYFYTPEDIRLKKLESL